MPDYTLVDHADAMIAKLDALDRVGVDTEFMREKTFFAELCLVQVSTGDRFYCVDPLNGDDMDFADIPMGRPATFSDWLDDDNPTRDA